MTLEPGRQELVIHVWWISRPNDLQPYRHDEIQELVARMLQYLLAMFVEYCAQRDESLVAFRVNRPAALEVTASLDKGAMLSLESCSRNSALRSSSR
jgi:hypothetical protein